MSEVAAYLAPAIDTENLVPAPAHRHNDDRVWVLRRHPRAALRQAHAITSVDWDAGVARASCGLELPPDEIDDIPSGGCLPCVLCVAATPLPSERGA